MKTPDPEPDRYAGSPLVILLENYILHCIGHISAQQEEGLIRVVQRAFGGGRDWKKTLRERLAIPDWIDEQVRAMWEQSQQAARQEGEAVDPVQFARTVVDSNFASLIRKPAE